ncbi:MAG TPA: S41 family peptidase [Ferruginibacter sp.]|nr:S41 family peptidase [Ferruginibacter sp.]
MKFFLFILITMLFSVKDLKAQPCNCTKALDDVRAYTQKNYAGFADKIKMLGKAAFEKHDQQARANARKIKDALHCANLLDNWLLFFKDNHLYMHYEPDIAWFKNAVVENISVSSIDTAALLKKKYSKPEGIYSKPDGSLAVAVVAQKNATMDYAGYILHSKLPAWKTGDLHFELKKQFNGLYKVIWYNNDHVPYTDQLDFEMGNAIVWNGWKKETDADDKSYAVHQQQAVIFSEEKEWPVFSKEINDSLLYFRIKSFNVKNLPAITAMLEDYKEKLSTTAHLIIDIRGNGGGGDICYRGFKKYLYTQPVISTGADFLATADNIKAYRTSIEEAGLPEADAKEYLADMDKAEAFAGSYYNMFPDEVDSSGTRLAKPQKIMILMDEKCASAAEQFLLEARQSKKAILVGQPSRGVLDYANVCEYKMEHYGMSLLYPTSRSRRIDNGQGIENKGIQPHYSIDFADANWLNKAIEKF